MTTYDSRPDTWAHIHAVQGYVLRIAADLTERAWAHDQSKLVAPEVEVFDEFTPKLRDSTYGSDEYKAFLRAWAPVCSTTTTRTTTIPRTTPAASPT
jgi:hypothetical protein